MNDKHSKRNPYPCDLTINKWKLTRLEISQYYKTKKGREMIDDNLIIKLVKSLNGKTIPPDPKKRPGDWDYFTLEPIFDEDDNPYCLVCCHENNSYIWGVVNIYPITIKSHDKKIKNNNK